MKTSYGHLQAHELTEDDEVEMLTLADDINFPNALFDEGEAEENVKKGMSDGELCSIFTFI